MLSLGCDFKWFPSDCLTMDKLSIESLLAGCFGFGLFVISIDWVPLIELIWSSDFPSAVATPKAVRMWCEKFKLEIEADSSQLCLPPSIHHAWWRNFHLTLSMGTEGKAINFFLSKRQHCCHHLQLLIFTWGKLATLKCCWKCTSRRRTHKWRDNYFRTFSDCRSRDDLWAANIFIHLVGAALCPERRTHLNRVNDDIY